MKILITGANGWLGRSLTEYIEKQKFSSYHRAPSGVQLGLMILPGEPLQSKDHQVFQGDVRDRSRVAQIVKEFAPDFIVHTAGMIHPSRTREFYEVNVKGTQNILEEAAACGVKKAVVLSSNSPFGFNKTPTALFDEQSTYNSYMNYGRSKMMMEQWIAHHKSALGSLQTCIVRAPWFYGPHQPDRQTLFFKMIRDGKFPIVGSGENLRSMAYTENLSEGIMRGLFLAPQSHSVYWIADVEPYSMNFIVDTVAQVLRQDFGMKVSERRVHLPSALSYVAEGVDFCLQSIGLYHQKFHVLSEMNRSIACSVRLAQKELGYVGAVRLAEGMRNSVEYCLSKNLL